jgi:hypothetical protein
MNITDNLAIAEKPHLNVAGRNWDASGRVAVAVLPPFAVWLLTPVGCPRWLFMWLLAVAVFASCKLLTWLFSNVTEVPRWRHWAYLLAWPGLNARRFLDPHCRPQVPARSEWLAGGFQAAAGVGLLWGAQKLVPAGLSPILLGWLGLVATALILHFGIFKLLSNFWRQAGIDAPRLMVAPLYATSVSDFWSNRWNTAFRDFAHQFFFRPLARRCGAAGALALSFVISGLIHDLVISVPAGGGYGRPTLYFVIQAAALLAERSWIVRRLRLGITWRGRLWTALVVLLPAGLLFHEPFIAAVVIPFMTVLGAA